MARLTTCICGCGRTSDNPLVDGFHAVGKADRGGRVAYICPNCSELVARYTAENNVTRGKLTTSGLTTGVEFECMVPDFSARVQFMSYEWLPSHDCTVDLEFKSPIYLSLNPLKGYFKTVDKLISSGHIDVCDNCGTHCHVGHADYIDYYTIAAIADRYHEIFDALSRYLYDNPTACERVFGRALTDFDGYAHAVHVPCMYDDCRKPGAYMHSNFVNLEHEHTIEFRVCRYRNATQYMHAIKTCHAMTECIINNYIKHYLNGATGVVLDRKAEVTAQKLVRLAEKAVRDAPTPTWY